ESLEGRSTVDNVGPARPAAIEAPRPDEEVAESVAVHIAREGHRRSERCAVLVSLDDEPGPLLNVHLARVGKGLAAEEDVHASGAIAGIGNFEERKACTEDQIGLAISVEIANACGKGKVRGRILARGENGDPCSRWWCIQKHLLREGGRAVNQVNHAR